MNPLASKSAEYALNLLSYGLKSGGLFLGLRADLEELDARHYSALSDIETIKANTAIALVETTELEERVLGQIRANAGGRGLNPNVGTPVQLQSETSRRANRAKGSYRDEERRQVAAREMELSDIRRAQRLTLNASLLGLANEGVKTAISALGSYPFEELKALRNKKKKEA